MRPDELPRYLPIKDRRMTNRGSHEPAEQAVRPDYDRQMAKVEKATLRALRESLLAAASGDVLEIETAVEKLPVGFFG